MHRRRLKERLVQKGSADLAFLYSGVWVRPALGSVESSGKSLPTPVSAILLEAVIIGEFAFGTTVASDSSVFRHHPNKIRAMVTPTRK
jgi:hypothetical protein